MSRFQFRGSIVLATFVAALLSSRPAEAQIFGDPDPYQQPCCLLTAGYRGGPYEAWDKAHAERRLHHLHARLRRDAERGDSAAVACDSRRIHNARFRIAVDEWLMRKNSLHDPGYYPPPIRLDSMTYSAIVQAGGRP